MSTRKRRHLALFLVVFLLGTFMMSLVAQAFIIELAIVGVAAVATLLVLSGYVVTSPDQVAALGQLIMSDGPAEVREWLSDINEQTMVGTALTCGLSYSVISAFDDWFADRLVGSAGMAVTGSAVADSFNTSATGENRSYKPSSLSKDVSYINTKNQVAIPAVGETVEFYANIDGATYISRLSWGSSKPMVLFGQGVEVGRFASYYNSTWTKVPKGALWNADNSQAVSAYGYFGSMVVENLQYSGGGFGVFPSADLDKGGIGYVFTYDLISSTGAKVARPTAPSDISISLSVPISVPVNWDRSICPDIKDTWQRVAEQTGIDANTALPVRIPGNVQDVIDGGVRDALPEQVRDDLIDQGVIEGVENPPDVVDPAVPGDIPGENIDGLPLDPPKDASIPWFLWNWLKAIWEAIKNGFTALLDFLKGLLGSIVGAITGLKDAFLGLLQSMLDKLAQLITLITSIIASLLNLGDFDITEDVNKFSLPQLFLLLIGVLLACIRLIWRGVVWVASIGSISPNTLFLNGDVITGIEYFKNMDIGPLNTSMWSLISGVFSLVYALSIFAIVKRRRP